MFLCRKSLRSYDPFRKQKEEQFYVSSGHITRFAKHLLSLSANSRNMGKDTKMEFKKLLKVGIFDILGPSTEGRTMMAIVGLPVGEQVRFGSVAG